MVNIILPISRTDYLRPIFNCLKELEIPEGERVELLIITDGDIELEAAVDRRLDNLNFNRTRIISFGDRPAEDIDSRRYRIAAIHNMAGQYIVDDCRYVFCIEDDTVFPPDTLVKMLDRTPVGFVQGVELGRRATPYIGAWRVDNIHNPMVVRSVLPDHLVYETIDAGGLYCALIAAQFYRQHHFEPLDKQGKMGLGCDVNLGLELRKKGYMCFIDWTIECDHIGDKGSVNLGNTRPVQVVFEKRKGIWSGRTEA